MTEFKWSVALTVFVVYILFDILYALYVICVSKRQAIRASFISSALYSLGAYGVMNYLENPWYVIPLACGAFIGTYIAVRYMSE